MLTRVQALLTSVAKGKPIIVDTLEHPFIGGLAIDAGLFPKYAAAGKLNEMLFLSGRPANEQHLLKMLGRKIPVIRDDSINVMEFLKWDGERSEVCARRVSCFDRSFGERLERRYLEIP